MTEKEIAVVDGLKNEGIASLKDKNGNPRFVEGVLPVQTIEGVSFTYHKWQLSGGHLMIVVDGNVDANTQITHGTILIPEFKLPSYIFNKIHTIYSAVVSWNNADVYSSTTAASSTLITRLVKSTNALYIDKIGNSTYNEAGSFHIQYDLIIDQD